MQMTEHTRKKTEIINRRQQVAEKYLRGAYMSQIAQDMGVDTATISRDLATLRKEWLERSIGMIDQRKAAELAKLDQLEMTYWQAWERSRQDAETVTQEKLGAIKDGDGKIVGTRVKEIKKREGQTGDPRFLDGVISCIKRRCDILGLDAPKTLSADMKLFTDVKGYAVTSPDDWDAGFTEP
jgi:hypothetical protein